jgi:hypothetical protein
MLAASIFSTQSALVRDRKDAGEGESIASHTHLSLPYSDAICTAAKGVALNVPRHFVWTLYEGKKLDVIWQQISRH